mmetsp:Transcript_13692/g.9847  ORF Transcript_13692/g.9847 Transcript_13692/m.9847 type:complete len:198 (+) Transcript_13692:1747-2340(+)
MTEKDKEMVKNEFVVLSPDIVFEALRQQNNNVVQWQSAQKGELDQAPEWEKSVEVLILNHKKISKIKGLEAFVNLRKLSMIDNCLVKIEGLSRCKLLEELSLEKNKLGSIDELQHLRYLKKLDLGRNRIKRIDNGLANLDNLTQLSIEDNLIQQLDGLDHLQSLMELYLGNNLISDVRETTKLKGLGRLIILDISGN